MVRSTPKLWTSISLVGDSRRDRIDISRPFLSMSCCLYRLKEGLRRSQDLDLQIVWDGTFVFHQEISPILRPNLTRCTHLHTSGPKALAEVFRVPNLKYLRCSDSISGMIYIWRYIEMLRRSACQLKTLEISCGKYFD